MKKNGANILVLDDEDDLRELLARVLELEDYNVFKASNPVQARKILSDHQVEVFISDVKLQNESGLDFIAEWKRISPFTEIIMLTAYGNIPDGVGSIKSGAFDYLTKGDDNNKIIPVVARAVEKARIARQIFSLGQQDDAHASFENIIGNSGALKKAVDMARKVAPADSSVLLIGDTGTGKEVFAQAIHEASPRSKAPFVAINCSAIGKEILESELFGHIKGSFTGAMQDKTGFFETAKGGSLFLDEIGEMSLDLQSKLLRVLESGTYYRVGSTKEQKSDVRIIAATNKNLEEEAVKGNFRLDLYYRLGVFTIELPTLAERQDDIKPLAVFFAAKAAAKMGKTIPEIGSDFIDALRKHHWKGNLRELRNVMEHATILCEGGRLQLEHLPQSFDSNATVPAIRGKQTPIDLESLEKDHIGNMLQYTGGNKTRTAEILGISLATLYRKINEYQL